MAFNVQDFRTNGLVLGGARPTLFEVTLDFPGVALTGVPASVQGTQRFLISAAQIPEARMGVVNVPYFGRTIKVNGDRTYPDWTVTVMNDEDFVIRRVLENWTRGINATVDNIQQAPFVNIGDATAGYKTSLFVRQYGKDGLLLKEYEFVGAFPNSVGAIALGWSATDRIETFDVTFSYDYWRVTNEEIFSSTT